LGIKNPLDEEFEGTKGVIRTRISKNFRACGSYQDFLDRGLLLTRKLLNQGFLVVKLKPSL
jgi:hypothetical protein